MVGAVVRGWPVTGEHTEPRPERKAECPRCGSDEWTYLDYGGCSECRSHADRAAEDTEPRPEDVIREALEVANRETEHFPSNRVIQAALAALDSLVAALHRAQTERDEALAVREGHISAVQMVIQLRDENVALVADRDRLREAAQALIDSAGRVPMGETAAAGIHSIGAAEYRELRSALASLGVHPPDDTLTVENENTGGAVVVEEWGEDG